MKKIKVFFILSTDDYSGAEAVNFTIIESLKSKIDFYWVSKKGNINNYLKEKNINWIEISSLSTKEIKRVVAEYKPDILHATDYKASVICALSNVKTKIISHLHNNSPWIKTLHFYSFLYLLASFKFNRILTVSKSIEKEYIFGKLIKNKIINISNPVSRENILEKVNIKEEKIYDVCFVGRLTEQKNPLHFVEIVNELKKSNKSINTIMVGNGDLYNEVKETISNLNLEDNIKLVGFQKNPFEYMNKSKIFCLPSLWEGYGLVAFEAMTLGLPAIVSPVGGLVELVDNNCGNLCKNTKEFVDEINTLLSDNKKLIKKSDEAILKSKRIDNLKEYMDKLYVIYSS